MTYRDDESSHAPDSHHALVGGPHHPSEALVAQTNGAFPSIPTVAMPGLAAQDVLRGGMDANTFLHALRRRWLLALCMGTVMAVLSGIALWYLFPESSSATALFQVSSEEKSLVFDLHHSDPKKFDILQKTQKSLLTSYFVLQAAVRDRSIASLSIFATEPDPVSWLQKNLIVDFLNQGEILSISLSGDDPSSDQKLVVDAVAKAYQGEVLFKNQQERLVTQDALAKSYGKLKDELSRKLEDYYGIAKELGSSDGVSRDVVADLLLSEISGLQKQKAELEAQLMEQNVDYLVNRQRLEGPLMIEQEVDEKLKSDPRMLVWQDQLLRIQLGSGQSGGTGRGARSRGNSGVESQMAQIEQGMKEYRAQLIKQLTNERRRLPNHLLQQYTKETNLMLSAGKQRMAQLEKTLEEKLKQLKQKVEVSVDLQTRQAELEQLKEIAKDMSIKLESVEIEAAAPEQIKLIQPAVVTENINSTQHYAIAILGALAAFGLTGLGIAYLEFRNRRLNGTEQVDEGLGIRVVGSLPSLSAKAIDATHPIVAQLTESIDSVRTILMHDSTTKRRQVVLVTSAAAKEGRTTVASHLAGSLARAGRRTLLVDGDLRSPSLHSLFDLPLEDGLCEVLRAEVDVADVIRPTHAEGLWLLTAGYCDVNAIHALATEQMQPVFDKLRSEYDFIIIDGAPVVGMSDALIFGQYSDGAVISVRRDVSHLPKIYQAAELLRSVGIRVIGAVVNGVQGKADDRVTQLRLIAPKSERVLEPSA